ncbi:MAG TPA: TolC family protein [Puia sp.]|nr:TolC family protein [Puia sp.]
MKKVFRRVFISSGFSFIWCIAGAQKAPDTLSDVTVQACVQYALKHYPQIQQAMLDEQITERQIKSRLADWYPQIGLAGSYQHYFQLPSFYFNGGVSPSGVANSSVIALGLSQTLFNRDVLLAARTKNDVMTSIRQTTVNDKINLAVNVSKAFYDVLLTAKQIDVLNDDIERLERNLKDAYNQYRGGLVDKTDYKRATISLNNSKAERKNDEESLKAKYALLKQLMGYTAPDSLHLHYDSAQMESEIYVDTLAPVDYSKRIEFQQLMTERRLQQADVKYNKWAYLPSVNANAAYNMNYFNPALGGLYANNYPSSYAGLQVNLPIFQGTKRTQNIRIAELQLTRIDWDVINLQTAISTEYAQAMAAYKGYLNNYYAERENLGLARDVFNTIELQYRSGIKAYLDLITAETDLRTAQLVYSNALFQVLASKLDVEKALGTVRYN